jgi:hypothetical protein
MKFNKWTLGLAAVGVVSLASAARADEKVSQLNTALSNTTISGYVDVGAQYESAAGAVAGAAPYSIAGGPESFSLNTVDIAIDKPEDATPFAAGYHIELWTGSATTGLTPVAPLSTGSIVRQAYLALGTTFGGQEIDWKIGVWDTIIGYEGLTSSGNPNYTHSYGFAVEPTTHTGIQGTYKLNDEFTFQLAVADDSYPGGNGGYSAAINGAAANPLIHPTTLGTIAYTAPSSWGPLSGATLTLGGIYTAGTNPGSGYSVSGYAGTTIPTPIAALKFGTAFDYVNQSQNLNGHVWVGGVYGTWTASDKLTFNARAEYYDQDTVAFIGTMLTAPGAVQHGEEFTVTAQYALWANVLSRLELRWDHAEYGTPFSTTPYGTAFNTSDALFAGAELIYTF